VVCSKEEQESVGRYYVGALFRVVKGGGAFPGDIYHPVKWGENLSANMNGEKRLPAWLTGIPYG